MLIIDIVENIDFFEKRLTLKTLSLYIVIWINYKILTLLFQMKLCKNLQQNTILLKLTKLRLEQSQVIKKFKIILFSNAYNDIIINFQTKLKTRIEWKLVYEII